MSEQETSDVQVFDPIDLGDNNQLPAQLRNRVGFLEPIKDTHKHIARFEETRKAFLKVVRTNTRPQDWVSMGKTVYLQGTGGERNDGAAGMIFLKPTFEREDYPDGTFAYVCTLSAASRLFETIGEFTGARWSGDEFFDKFDEAKPKNHKSMPKREWLDWRMAHRLPVDPTDVRKAAQTNAEVRARGKLCGLRGLTREDLAGVKIGTTVTYEAGARGGSAQQTDSKGVPCVPFGKNQGAPVTELSPGQLRWYTENAEKNLASPEYSEVTDPETGEVATGDKFRYRAKEEKWLEDLKAEAKRREGDEAPAE